MKEVTRELVASWLPERPAGGHKGTFGRVLIAAGSVGFSGAPALAANAAVRSGTGLVFLGVPGSVWPVAAVKCDEAMPFPLPEDETGRLCAEALSPLLERAKGCDALLMGPGLGQSEALDELVLGLLGQWGDRPAVVDADGLNALSRHIDSSVTNPHTVLTPHDGEYARLMGRWPGENRGEAALALARQWNCVAVLKGHGTCIAAPWGELWRSGTGNHGMAKGGSGDVLSGILVSLLAQGMKPVQAAAAAVWVHGRAGDLAAEQFGYRGMAPSDLSRCLGQVWRELKC